MKQHTAAFTFRVIVLLAVLGTTSLATQTPNPALGSLAGSVVDGVTGEPIAGVGVSMCGQYAYAAGSVEGTQERESSTDAQGRFSLTGLLPGNYHVCVAGRAIYLPDRLRSYELRAGEEVRGIVKRTWPSAAIDGRVLDERGAPASGVRVSLLQSGLRSGILGLFNWSAALTDADGRFHLGKAGVVNLGGFERGGRLALMTSAVQVFVPETAVPASGPFRGPIGAVFAAGGLPAPSSPPLKGSTWNGFVELLTEPMARNGDLARQARVDPLLFFPSAPAGRPIEFFPMAAGEARRDISVQLRPAPAFRVSGRLTAANAPVRDLVLSLERADLAATEHPIVAAVCLTDATGRFAFLRVPEGSYRLRADTAPYGGGLGGRPAQYPPTVSVDAPIDVKQDLDALSIEARRGVSIHGSIRFEGTSALPGPGLTMAFSVRRVDGRGGNLPWMPIIDRSFASVELPPGEYLLRPGGFGSPPGWILKSAVVDEKLDMADVPLVLGSQDPGDVVVTFGPETEKVELRGVVRTVEDQPDAEAAVLVFPTDRRYWSHNEGESGMSRTRMALTSRLGAYTIAFARPGEYFVAAVPETEEIWNLPNPELFERLALRATRVTVKEGATAVQDLRTQK